MNYINPTVHSSEINQTLFFWLRVIKQVPRMCWFYVNWGKKQYRGIVKMDRESGGDVLVTCTGQGCDSCVTVTCWACSWLMNAVWQLCVGGTVCVCLAWGLSILLCFWFVSPCSLHSIGFVLGFVPSMNSPILTRLFFSTQVRLCGLTDSENYMSSEK